MHGWDGSTHILPTISQLKKKKTRSIVTLLCNSCWKPLKMYVAKKMHFLGTWTQTKKPCFYMYFDLNTLNWTGYKKNKRILPFSVGEVVNWLFFPPHRCTPGSMLITALHENDYNWGLYQLWFVLHVDAKNWNKTIVKKKKTVLFFHLQDVHPKLWSFTHFLLLYERWFSVLIFSQLKKNFFASLSHLESSIIIILQK